MRHPSVFSPTVIHTKIKSSIALLLHLASRVLALRTQPATNRSNLALNLSLNIFEPFTGLKHLFLDLLNP